MTEIQNLQNQINELKKQLNDLMNVSTFPYDLQKIIEARLNVLSADSTSSATTQDINLTGNAQTITVPTQPSGSLIVKFNGIPYSLLYK